MNRPAAVHRSSAVQALTDRRPLRAPGGTLLLAAALGVGLGIGPSSPAQALMHDRLPAPGPVSSSALPWDLDMPLKDGPLQGGPPDVQIIDAMADPFHSDMPQNRDVASGD